MQSHSGHSAGLWWLWMMATCTHQRSTCAIPLFVVTCSIHLCWRNTGRRSPFLLALCRSTEGQLEAAVECFVCHSMVPGHLVLQQCGMGTKDTLTPTHDLRHGQQAGWGLVCQHKCDTGGGLILASASRTGQWVSNREWWSLGWAAAWLRVDINVTSVVDLLVSALRTGQWVCHTDWWCLGCAGG